MSRVPAVGDAIGPLRPGVVSRTTLALFAGASGDHNPLHIDLDAARTSGRDDVIAHGMLGMAWLGRLLEECFGQPAIETFGARFAAVTPVNADVACAGVVRAVEPADGGSRVVIDLWAELGDGTVTIRGEAVCLLTHDEEN